ncbi:MAG: carboxypeptidase-like regulatory domain-containing protein [Candidatus Thermoplasmatota archaeon]|nr:carboxypeptidase-like regulatory domain-containing protein [Candidatus Thermoplasmatota archaeon]
MGDDDVTGNYIDELTGLTEPTNELMFASSGAKLAIEVDEFNSVGNSIAVLILVTCLLGLANGVDFTQPESGLVRPDEFVFRFAQNAPDESAIFNGYVFDDKGEPIENATVYISWYEEEYWNTSSSQTNLEGYFELEKLDPGITRVDIIVDRDNYKDRYSNRVLLSPPALFEPYGFTSIDFIMPSQEKFAEQECADGSDDCTIREIDNSPKQMEHPLMDSGASMIYSTIGIGFIGLSLLGAGFAIWAFKTGSVYLLRTASVLSFFTMGHYYSACLFSLVAFVLTFTISKPKKEIN